jgi:5-methylthioadenosine/S-adenosylhomocysteine deaminase
MIGLGPHAPYSVSDDVYLKCYDLAQEHNTYIHTHLSETSQEVVNSESDLGMTPIEHMAQLGILDRILAAHCVHLRDQDFDLLKKEQTTVLHNPQSNLKLGSGIANIPKMLENGINVLIGTDGSASNNNLDMLEEMRTTTLLHKGINMNPKLVNSKTTIDMATINAHVILGKFYSGKIAENSPADIVVWDLKEISTTPIISPISNLLYAASPKSVKMNIINGNVLYSDGEFTTIDIENVKTAAQSASDRMRAEANR